jgi:two-component system sensor histidine kinase KdpD
MADPQLAETALANLLQNAGKYTPPGAMIRVRVGGDATAGWIEVEDDGPGFPEPIEPLFEKFARGVHGDGRAPGTGLGLAIARGFAEAQGGRVEAFNRRGGGASVRLVLPLAETP